MKELRIISQQDSNFQMYSVDGECLIPSVPSIKGEHYQSLSDMNFSRFRRDVSKDGRNYLNTSSSEHSTNSEYSSNNAYTSSETSNNSE